MSTFARRTAKPVLLRLDDLERGMVEQLAARNGLTLSDVVRQAIRRWHAQSQKDARREDAA